MPRNSETRDIEIDRKRIKGYIDRKIGSQRTFVKMVWPEIETQSKEFTAKCQLVSNYLTGKTTPYDWNARPILDWWRKQTT